MKEDKKSEYFLIMMNSVLPRRSNIIFRRNKMSYTNRFGQPQGVAKELTTKLREVLIAEVIAIYIYVYTIDGKKNAKCKVVVK